VFLKLLHFTDQQTLRIKLVEQNNKMFLLAIFFTKTNLRSFGKKQLLQLSFFHREQIPTNVDSANPNLFGKLVTMSVKIKLSSYEILISIQIRYFFTKCALKFSINLYEIKSITGFLNVIGWVVINYLVLIWIIYDDCNQILN
jgi:hypothetical protein